MHSFTDHSSIRNSHPRVKNDDFRIKTGHSNNINHLYSAIKPIFSIVFYREEDRKIKKSQIINEKLRI